MPILPPAPEGTRIAFFGPMCSGKSTCAKYLVDNYGYQKLALADKIKSIAYELYGVTSKDGQGRHMYQKIGDYLREFDDDCFTKYTLERIRIYNYPKVVIDDLRLPQEARLLQENGFQLIRVDCADEVRLNRVRTLYPNAPEASQSHASETSWGAIVPHTSVVSERWDNLTVLDDLMSAYSEGRD